MLDRLERVLAGVGHLPAGGIHRAQHPALGVGEEAQRVLLVLVGPEVVGALHRFARLVHQLGHLLPGGRVAEHERVGPGAEAHEPGQAQVVVHDAADALVAVLREAAVGVVEVLLAQARTPLLKVAGRESRVPANSHIKERGGLYEDFNDEHLTCPRVMQWVLLLLLKTERLNQNSMQPFLHRFYPII